MSNYTNKTIKQNSSILLGSVETHECDPLMDCPECHGTGTCQQCKGQGEVKCHDCHGNGQCTDCHGKGRWRCDECGGSGNCRKCHGTGDVRCSNCNGSGKVKHKDYNGNQGWINCPKCGGSGSTPCPDCRSGMQSAVKALDIITFGAGCTYGHGSGKCSKCGGSGEIVCKTCSGSGDCPTCNGTGQLTCNHCEGSGDCPNCNDGKVTCERCNGSGFYQTFIRQKTILYSKGWLWSGSTEYKDIVKISNGIKLHDGPIKTWIDARNVEKDIVEATNQKCKKALGQESDLYDEFLTEYAKQSELSQPNDRSDKPYAKTLKAQKVPVTKIKYSINDENYEVIILGNNNIVAAKSVPTVIKGFELSKWKKIKLAMTEKSRLKAFARLSAYIFQCDGKSIEESMVLDSVINALKMEPLQEEKFREELEGLNNKMPYEQLRKKIKPLLHSKKTITFAWECMAVDKKVTDEEIELFNNIVAEYDLEQSEVDRLKKLAYKFSKLKTDQIAIEYADISDEFSSIRKKVWKTILYSVIALIAVIGITAYSILKPERQDATIEVQAPADLVAPDIVAPDDIADDSTDETEPPTYEGREDIAWKGDIACQISHKGQKLIIVQLDENGKPTDKEEKIFENIIIQTACYDDNVYVVVNLLDNEEESKIPFVELYKVNLLNNSCKSMESANDIEFDLENGKATLKTAVGLTGGDCMAEADGLEWEEKIIDL